MSVRAGARDHHRIGWDEVTAAMAATEGEHQVSLVFRLQAGVGGARQGQMHLELLAYPKGKPHAAKYLHRLVSWYPNGRATTAAAALWRLVVEMDYVLSGKPMG